MKLAHPYYFQPIVIEPHCPQTLVIENPKMYRQVVSQLINQCNGDDGDFVLSENNSVFDISKRCVVVSDVFRMDFVNRDIKTKIQKMIEADIVNDDRTREVITTIEQFGAQIAESFNYPLSYKFNLSPSDLVKLLAFEIDEEEASLLEQMIDYFDIYTNILGRKLIITLNLKDFLSKEEHHIFCQDLANRNVCLLMMESHVHAYDKPQQRVILDQDLCEI